MANETILVIDDTTVNLKLTAAVLRSAGYVVHVYTAAEPALLALRTLRPQLILIDIRLPGMNGLEFTRQILAEPRNRSILVVALSASIDEEDRTAALEAGCTGYLTKPIDTRSFADQIREFLQPQAPLPRPGVEAPAVTPAPTKPTRLTLSGPEMDDLRRSFLTDGTRQSRGLLASLDGQFDASQGSEMAHRWIGAAGVRARSLRVRACGSDSMPQPTQRGARA